MDRAVRAQGDVGSGPLSDAPEEPQFQPPQRTQALELDTLPTHPLRAQNPSGFGLPRASAVPEPGLRLEQQTIQFPRQSRLSLEQLQQRQTQHSLCIADLDCGGIGQFTHRSLYLTGLVAKQNPRQQAEPLTGGPFSCDARGSNQNLDTVRLDRRADGGDAPRNQICVSHEHFPALIGPTAAVRRTGAESTPFDALVRSR